MKQNNTGNAIIYAALKLFSEQGFDSVSVGQIAKAVGIKAPSLYNHFAGKQEIFDAVVDEITAQYDRDTDKIDIHVQNASQDISFFEHISEDMLVLKVRQMFEYSLHNEKISRFRKMMTIEQFRSPKLAQLYTTRYVDRITAYHAELFRRLAEKGSLKNEDPDTLAMMYSAPLFAYLGICDRQPEKEAECLKRLEAHVRLFYRTYNI